MNTVPGLTLRPYAAQLPEWPGTGRHIMAQFDDDSIIVYQAYCPAIAKYAVAPLPQAAANVRLDSPHGNQL